MKESDNTFLFLPDISGFSAFVNQTEVNHSRHIISELLELLLKTNVLELEVVEVEGDAIFFFKTKKIPSLEELFIQTESMFLAFHNHLEEYEAHRICKCGACKTANKLTLKFIAHSGPVEPIKIGKFRKLHGNDVIVSHRLMKNDIPSHEYLLVTKRVMQEMEDTGFVPDKQFNPHEAASAYENTGEVDYTYFDFKFLHQKVQTYKAQYHENIKSNTISLTEEIAIEPYSLFDIISNLKYRKKWNHSIKELYNDSDNINQSGDTHSCVVNNMVLQIETIPVKGKGADIVYGERIARQGILKNIQLFYTVKPVGDKSRLVFEVSFQFLYPFLAFMKPYLYRRLSKMSEKMVRDLKYYAEHEHKTQPFRVDISKMIEKFSASSEA